jgi:hypothetical protein
MHTTFRLIKSLAAGFALVLLGHLDAMAVPVSPGAAAVPLPGTTVAARPELAGTVLEDVSTSWASAIDPMYGFPGAAGSL